MKTLRALTVALLGLLLVLESGEGAKKGSNGAPGVSKKATAPGRSEQLPSPSQKSKPSAAKELVTDDKKPLKPGSQSLAGERKATLPSKRSLLEEEDDQDDDDDEFDDDDDDDDELEDDDEEPMTDDEDEEGGVDEEEEEGEEEYDDDEEDGDDDEEEERPRGGRQRSKASDWHYSDKPRIPGTKGKGGVFGLMRGAAKMTSSSVSNVVGMFSPNKYVGLKELAGTWKMKQKVLEFSGEVLRCEATIEIRRDGTVATFFMGKLRTSLITNQELKSEYLFKERQWPRACIIEFEAKAFKGPYDREPQPKFYKGYIKRSIVKRKQIRIEGKIYEIKGTFFWRQKQQIGRFRAVKKVSR